MKFGIFLVTAALLLTGCGAAETFETVGDIWAAMETAAPARQVRRPLPEEAAAAAGAGDGDPVYQCDGYELTSEVLPGGDLHRTVKTVSGFEPERLTILKTGRGGVSRYDFVWTAAGEEGEQVGRAAVLDDGRYHYVLTVQADAARSGELTETWNQLFSGFSLESEEY